MDHPLARRRRACLIPPAGEHLAARIAELEVKPKKPPKRPELSAGVLFNRRNRRRIEKIILCARRRTKAPIGVMRGLTTLALEKIGEAYGVKILPTGRCIPRNDSALAEQLA